MIKQTAKDVLSKINEPILNKDFVSLDFIKNISLNGKELNIALGITDVHYKGLDKLRDEIIKAIKDKSPSLDDVELGFSLGIVNHKNKKKAELLITSDWLNQVKSKR